MKVIIITAMFPPIRTGTSFYSANLATALTNLGCEVNVVTVKNNEANDQEYNFTIDRIPCLHITAKNYFKHLRFTSLFPKNYRLIDRKIKEIKPDIVLLINHYLDIAFPAVYAARKNEIPLLVSVGTQIQSNKKCRNIILNKLDRLIVGNLIFPNAKRIVSWDKEIEKYIRDVQNERNASKSYIIPYGVNGDISKYKTHKHDYNQTLQIIGVGAIIEQRNYFFAIKVFKELTAHYPNLIFKIIGHEYYKDTRKLVEDLGLVNKVIFTGELPHCKVLEEVGKSTIGFTITSGHYTGLGTSTIETMLMGVPTISKAPQDLFGSNAKLNDFADYIFTDGENVDKSVKDVLTVLRDVETRKRIGAGGRSFVEKHMSWDNVGKNYIDLIKKCINE